VRWNDASGVIPRAAASRVIVIAQVSVRVPAGRRAQAQVVSAPSAESSKRSATSFDWHGALFFRVGLHQRRRIRDTSFIDANPAWSKTR